MTEQTQLTDEQLQTVDEIVHDLFSRLEIAGEFSVTANEEIIDVTLETEDSGIVIGYHGEVLEALQVVLSLMIAKKLGSFHRVSVEIGDYKRNRTEYLEKLAQQTKERVLTDNREQTISQLKSWERRVVHMLLQDDDEVVSESVGEGKDRVLVIRPR
jgi:spoIIIJ-associated protein